MKEMQVKMKIFIIYFDEVEKNVWRLRNMTYIKVKGGEEKKINGDEKNMKYVVSRRR